MTDAEAEELHDLNARHLAPPAEPVEPVTRSTPVAPIVAAVTSASVADGTIVRRRWLLPVVTIVAVVLGAGIGWLLFSGQPGPTAMDASQQNTWTKLEASGQYDPGSIHLVGHKYDADVWTATQRDSTVECLLMTRGGDPVADCRPLDQQSDDAKSLQATMSFTEGGIEYSMWATLMNDITGNPVAVMQRQDANNTWDWRSIYTPDELTTVDTLVSAGYDGQSLRIAGYDGNVPVWVFMREQTCVMIVQNGALTRQCGVLSIGGDPLVLAVADTTYAVSLSEQGVALTIQRGAGGTGDGG